MIHTLNIKKFLYNYEAREVKGIPFSYKPEKTECTGIRACIKKAKNTDQKYLDVILNLHELAKGDKDLRQILTPTEIKQAISIYDKEIIKMTPERIHHKVTFDHMNLRRVDYSIDLDLPENITNTYIKLIKKGNLDKPTLKAMSRNKEDYPNLHISKTTMGINIYNKAEELRKHKKCKFVSEDKKVLRLEIQDKQPYEHNVGLSYEYSELEETLRKSSTQKNTRIVTNALNSFSKVYDNCIGKYVGFGTFYSVKNATEKIKASELSGKDREELIAFINDINKYQSIYATRTHTTSYKIKKYTKQLDKLGIAWVPIPDSWGIDKLTSLWDLIDDKYNELYMREEYPELF